MIEIGPLGLRDQFRNRSLYLDRVGLVGPSKTAHEAAKVCVNCQTGNAESVAQHHIRRLPTNSWQANEFLEIRGDFTIELLTQGLRHRDDVGGLRSEEPG